MRIVSWNINGLRAILKKNFCGSVQKISPDILCLQETRVDQSSVPAIELDGFTKFFNSAEKRGYSGTALFSKIQPINVSTNTEIDALIEPKEGRVILAEYEKFYLINVYTPNSGAELSRLAFRHEIWDKEMLRFTTELRKTKPVILCGDMNVAHEEIDLSNPDANHFSAGFTDEEREGMSNYISSFGIDSFRKFFPNSKDSSSWWSYRMRSRERNVGWRIDYIIVDRLIEKNIKSAFIYKDILGSDHAPVGIDLAI